MTHNDEYGAAPTDQLEPPIKMMIDATNRGDRDALLGAFAGDATLIDFGRTFAGKREIARWNDNENIGTQNRITVTSVDRSGPSVAVGVTVTGNGYNGGGSLHFALENDRITRLLITA